MENIRGNRMGGGDLLVFTLDNNPTRIRTMETIISSRIPETCNKMIYGLRRRKQA
jgi:hypothetical protein